MSVRRKNIRQEKGRTHGRGRNSVPQTVCLSREESRAVDKRVKEIQAKNPAISFSTNAYFRLLIIEDLNKARSEGSEIPNVVAA
jgi:hypothetical protein